jgi:hypothetical protein|tara:strand:- start:142 stop:669 length:528 start_codon:yes stop_codon:yes gene_type:complete
MKIRTRITTKGDLTGLADEIGRMSEPKYLSNKLKAKELFSVATIKEMKESIRSGKTFTSLKKSTREIRRQRREKKGRNVKHLTKPLFETGALFDSIKETQKGISFLKYGVHQANGFTVDTGGKFRGGSVDGTFVPARDFITVPTKKALEVISKELVNRVGKLMAKRLRPNVIVRR